MTEYSQRPGTAVLFTAGEIAAIVGGSSIGNLDALVSNVVVDSRKAGPGSLFVALPGERADGHDFIASALRGGASCILAEASAKHKALEQFKKVAANTGPASASLTLVDSCLASLQYLAADHGKRMRNLLKIGVTGSSGKTTTKECIGAALAGAYPSGSLVMSEGNLNSDIGLALSMFSLRPEHRVAVFEMGMNRVGEMDELAAMFPPDLAVITNIGTAHIGLIGSRDGIAAQKKRIFSLFSGSQKGIVWEDDPYKSFLKEGVRGEVLEFGPRTTPGVDKIENLGLDGWSMRWRDQPILFPLPGSHNLLDALAALSVASALGVDPEKVAAGLSSVKPLFGRSEILKGKIALLRDCYNANPDSVQAAIEFCDSVEWKGRKVYVLGSMLELGQGAAAEHVRMGERAFASSASALFFFGPDARGAFEAAEAMKTRDSSSGSARIIFHTNDMDELTQKVAQYLREGDLVLAKASRGLALERLTDDLQRRGLVPADPDTREARHAS